MLIIITILWIAAWFGIGYLTRRIIDAKIKRKNEVFANLPTEVLLTHALLNPVYASHYRNLQTIMSKDKASEMIVNHMLFDMGLVGYRKI